jgi:polysaccharide chain length determinant protein (PEP-CTERM system associated)
MLGHRQLTIDDYFGILRRRVWLVVIPAIICGIAGYLISLKLPNRYVSQTVVLVEGQRVPDSIVKPVLAGDVNEHLASMKEQILSRTRLEPILQQFNLFNNQGLHIEERIDELTKAIVVDPVQPMAQTRASSLPGFRISVTLDDPRVAQLVCSEISSMFTNENLHSQQEQAETTTIFLDDQVAAAQQRMNLMDAKLATFKQHYVGMLPEQEQTNLNLLTGLNTQLDVVAQALDREQQNKTMWESMLSQQLADWRASLQVTQGGTVINPVTIDDQLKRKQDELAALETKYTDDYPDVKTKKAEIDQLKRRIAAAESAMQSAGVPNPKPTVEPAAPTMSMEPAQVQALRAQIGTAKLSIQEKEKQIQKLQADIHTLQSRVQTTPVVEQQYRELTRDFTTAQADYDNLLHRQSDARMSRDLELRQQGERFRTLDPASLPDRPASPNRPLIAGAGFGGGIALGIGLIMLLELRDKSLRTESDIEMFLKLPTLALVPSIQMDASSAGRLLFRAGKGNIQAEGA